MQSKFFENNSKSEFKHINTDDVDYDNHEQAPIFKKIANYSALIAACSKHLNIDNLINIKETQWRNLLANLYFNLGLEYKKIYGKSENMINAIKAYNQAIELDPYNPAFYYNRANAFEKMENIKAVEDYDQVVKFNENLDQFNIKAATALFRKGKFLERIGKENEALECFKLSVEKDSRHIYAYIHLQKLYSSLIQQLDKREDASIQCFNLLSKHTDRSFVISPAQIETLLNSLKIKNKKLSEYDKERLICEEKIERLKDRFRNDDEYMYKKITEYTFALIDEQHFPCLAELDESYLLKLQEIKNLDQQEADPEEETQAHTFVSIVPIGH